MAKPKEILSRDDYRNYRNIRAVSVLFALLGSIFVLGGTTLLCAHIGLLHVNELPHPGVALIMVIAGLSGAIGGIAALRGNRRWASLIYAMAALYVFAFPLGTILSVVMFTGLKRYLDSVEQVRAAPPATQPQ